MESAPFWKRPLRSHHCLVAFSSLVGGSMRLIRAPHCPGFLGETDRAYFFVDRNFVRRFLPRKTNALSYFPSCVSMLSRPSLNAFTIILFRPEAHFSCTLLGVLSRGSKGLLLIVRYVFSAFSHGKRNSVRVAPSSVSMLSRSFLTFFTSSLLHFEAHLQCW